MNLTFLAIALSFPIVLSLGAMGYLKPILSKVLTEICGTQDRGEFWIRCATILSLFGATILVLAFGPKGGDENMVDDVRKVLTLALSGGFIGIAWISRTIWNSLTNCPETRARLFKEESKVAPDNTPDNYDENVF